MVDSRVEDNFGSGVGGGQASTGGGGDQVSPSPTLGDGAPVDPSFDPAVDFINNTVISVSTSQDEAMGKVYQAVSQSMALAVQDGTDNLRNFSTVNLAALSYAQEQLVATKDVATWAPIITDLQTALTTQIAAFNTLGTDAASILQTFMKETPSVSSAPTAPSFKSSTPRPDSVTPTPPSNSGEGASESQGGGDGSGAVRADSGTADSSPSFLRRFFNANKQGEK